VSPESKPAQLPGALRAPLALGYFRRLHQRREFLRFFEGSEVRRLSRCTVFRVPNASGHFRLGVTFKARMNSVERNALRRRIREAVRKQAPTLGSFDYNVVVREIRRPAKQFARELARELSLLSSHRPVPSRSNRKPGSHASDAG